MYVLRLSKQICLNCSKHKSLVLSKQSLGMEISTTMSEEVLSNIDLDWDVEKAVYAESLFTDEVPTWSLACLSTKTGHDGQSECEDFIVIYFICFKLKMVWIFCFFFLPFRLKKWICAFAKRQFPPPFF